MRYITLISNRTYQRPRLGCVVLAPPCVCSPVRCSLLQIARALRLQLARLSAKAAREALPRMSFTDLPRYNPARSQSGASHMIKRYSDHAANERTFLAWVRTAIAVMAFGFVIERFDLFLQLAAPQLALKQAAPHGQMFANVAGLGLYRHRRGDDRHRRLSFPQNRQGHRDRGPTCRAPASASISRSPFCSCCWAWRCFFICRAPCCRRSDLPAACEAARFAINGSPRVTRRAVSVHVNQRAPPTVGRIPRRACRERLEL